MGVRRVHLLYGIEWGMGVLRTRHYEFLNEQLFI